MKMNVERQDDVLRVSVHGERTLSAGVLFASAAVGLFGWMAVNFYRHRAVGQASMNILDVGFGMGLLVAIAAFAVVRMGTEEYRFDARELVVSTKFGIPLRVRCFALSDITAISIEETRRAKSPIPTRQLGIHWRGRVTRTWLILDDDVLVPLVELLRSEVSSRTQGSCASTPEAGR
jgi:hypothetical protein